MLLADHDDSLLWGCSDRASYTGHRSSVTGSWTSGVAAIGSSGTNDQYRVRNDCSRSQEWGAVVRVRYLNVASMVAGALCRPNEQDGLARATSLSPSASTMT